MIAPALRRGAWLAVLFGLLAACRVEPPSEPGPIAMRRLTEAQYRNSIADLFGDGIAVTGPFELDPRNDGLTSVGSTWATVSATGFEHYERIARQVAAQVLDGPNRAAVLPCQPPREDASDDPCATRFVSEIGRRLFRRSLTAEEVELRVALAGAAATEAEDFHTGLRAALVSLLIAPDFLFRIEHSEADAEAPELERLTGPSMASRLSFLLWNGPPDDELLRAAEAGELSGRVGIQAQVDRMLEDRRLEVGLRAFFDDLLGLDAAPRGLVHKDPLLFPAFSQALMADAREQTLRTIVDHLLGPEADYRALFTTRHTVLNRNLGIIYRVPVASAEGWEAYEFPQGNARPGILGHASLMAIYAHAGRSSPTLRGKFVRERLLCTPIDAPPADIDFSLVEDVQGVHATARDRLAAHNDTTACGNCHAAMDPIGFGLEHYDAIGAHRDQENGVDIDASGELDGIPFADAVGLGQALHDHPRLGACLTLQLFRHAFGRSPGPGEAEFRAYLEAELEGGGYDAVQLLRLIATSEAFRSASGPREAGGSAP
jgi:hypothetical protein